MNILNILEKYESPESEASFYKGIPIKYLKDVQKSLLFYDSLDGVKTFRYIFRGKSKPGFKRPQAWCPKAHADTFAVYEKGVNNFSKLL